MFAATRGLRLWNPVRGRVRPPSCGRADALTATSAALCAGTYCIMADWVYGAYVDLWHGVYGLDDEDDEDDDDDDDTTARRRTHETRRLLLGFPFALTSI
ncbi:uncharacterized protein Tco025E_00346 [Trypanosoma conorhini]|uniref:Uncharacterized protein n=1 Tax=Trypanosoma conorhini TaxID=83891 RepID=A0A3R7N913_9TRYP|nr:uncharacterized protein Tco025E_00346 [Trypanosoma conorhini]RNF27416.1 hypothetical protein Tco025E_00346 [Trypanosoma conorhini]